MKSVNSSSLGPLQAHLTALNLPPNSYSGGLVFDDSPGHTPTVIRIEHASLADVDDYDGNARMIGSYLESVCIPGVVEIRHIATVDRLQAILTALQQKNLPRQIVLTTIPPPVDGDGCRYHIPLPEWSSAELTFDGFPPTIKSIDPSSSLTGIVHRSQVVDSIHVPGRPVLSIQSGGFTVYRIQKELKETAGISGRVLVIKDQDVATAAAQRKERPDAFDWGGFFGGRRSKGRRK